ncbi:MAG: ammonium transporter [bacterium]|nr:ammonium transporter [bacterium]MCP4964267.1 ammonium transporter [bacterium]
MRKGILGIGLVALAMFGPLAGIASAKTDIETVATGVDEMWLVLAAALVMFMQAGFALVEAGFTRAKNAGNIIMKNFMDFSVGGIVYWALGFGLAYGGTSVGGLFAFGDGFFFNDASRGSEWLFQVVFAATAATIVSGAVAGRVKFVSYLIYTPFITGLIYPVVSHWVWDGRGWLAELGYIDFAGSGVVHLLGGVAAFAGVLIVGPRIGKYDDNGKPRAVPGHSLTLGALGVMILWFGWYGFNAGSTLGAVGQDVAYPAVTTTLAACAGAMGAMSAAWAITGKPDVGFTLNGVLAGLVGITAGTASIGFSASILVGAIAGVLMVLSVIGLERAGFDDPVGAISVHGTAGLWGVLAVGVFGGGSFVNQAIGAGAIIAWTLIASLVVFKLVDSLVGMRVSAAEELSGLDRSEHGADSYPEFVFREQVADPRELDPVGSNGH